MAVAGDYSRRVPGFAGTIAVDVVGAECLRHERRWHDNDLDVVIRDNTAGDEPVAQLVVVTGMRVHDRQAERPAARAPSLFDHRPQCRAGDDRVEIGAGACCLHPFPQRV